MKKRVISLILALALLCALLPQVTLYASADVYSGDCGDNLIWSLNTNTGVLTISGTGQMTDWDDLGYVPWDSYRTSIASVVLPNGLTNIGKCAFYNTSLTNVTIPNSVTRIGKYAFYKCSSLTSVTIPNSVTSIGDNAFGYCVSLKTINVLSGNPYYSSLDGVLFNKNKTTLFQCPGGKSGTYMIPDSMTSIGDYAFDGCLSLTSVTIPDSVTNIGYRAFVGCTSLTSVTIGNGVTNIGHSAFYFCSSLTSVTIPDSVTSIGDCAFYYCSSLTSVTIGNSVTSIGYRAFYDCPSLTSVIIPASVKEIGTCAFGYRSDSDLGTFVIVDGFTIYGCKNSAAQSYAEENGIPFKTICDTYGHKWDEVKYSWSSDLSKATASRTCTWDASHQETETVETTVKVTKPPTATAAGEKVYTATFKNSAFKTQTKKVAIPKYENPFVDVHVGEYFCDPVLWAFNHDPQITKGTDATHFSPSAPCNRAQVVTFLWRANGCPEPKSDKNPFKDVKSNTYYYKAVLWAVEQKITKGTGATTFSPEKNCSRAEIVTFLWRSNGSPKLAGENQVSNPFVDIKKGAYYYDAVLWAVAMEITKGKDLTHFSPGEICTRGQVVTFLYRAEN